MKLDDLREEHLIEGIRLYESHCGYGREFSDAMFQEPETVLRNLRKESNEEYRIGSKWDMHSKIYFKTDFEGNLIIRFNPNLIHKAGRAKGIVLLKKLEKNL